MNKNNYKFNADDEPTLICDHFKWLLDNALQLTRELNDEDGEFTTDQFSMAVQDRFVVSGTAGGSPVTHDFSEDRTSFWDWFFLDEGAVYTIFVSRYVDGINDELFFIGDLDPLTIPRDHTGTIHQHTENAERLQNLELKWSMCSERLVKLTVAALVESMGQTDMTNSDGKACFYGGSFPRTSWSLPWLELESYLENDNFASLYPEGYSQMFQKASYGTQLPGDWPYALWGISLDKIAEKIAALAEFDYETSSTCMFAPYRPEYTESEDSATYQGYRISGAPGNTAQNIHVNYNIAFGVNPVEDSDPATFECPVSYQSDASIGSVLRDLCFILGGYPQITYNQESKRPVLSIVSRTASFGDVPANLIPSSSQEVERQVGKERIEMSFRADDSRISCPQASGDAIRIEIPWRWRAWGTEEAIRASHHIQNKKLKFIDQLYTWKLTPDNLTRLERDGWLGGAYLYYYSTETSNQFYPDGVGLTSSLVGQPSNWSGFYAATHYIYDGPEGVAPEPLTHPLESLARFYAHQLLGTRMVLEREYIGITDEDGNITGINLLQRINEAIRTSNGETRELKAIRVVQNLSTERTSMTFVEVLANDEGWQDAPVFLNGEFGSSTGGTGTSTPNGEIIAPEIYLKQSPELTEQNIAEAQAADVVPLTVKLHASQTENAFNVTNSSDDILAYFRNDATLHTPTASLAVAAKTTTYTLTNTDHMITCNGTFTVTTEASPRTGQEFEVKNIGSGTITVSRSGSQTLDGSTTVGLTAGESGSWRYDGSVWRRIATVGASVDLSGLVTKTPSATQTIVAQADNIVALGITPHTDMGASDRPLRINDSAGAEVSGADGFGRIVTKRTLLQTLSSDLVGYQTTMHSSQTANPIEIYDSSSSLKFSVNKDGGFKFNGGVTAKFRTVTGDTTLTTADCYVRVNNGANIRTITLPDATTCSGLFLIIKRLGSANVIVDGNGSQLIDSSITISLGAPGSFVELISNGAGWDII